MYVLVCEFYAGLVKVSGLFSSTCMIPLHLKVTHAPKAGSSQEGTFGKQLQLKAAGKVTGNVWGESSVWMFSFFCNLLKPFCHFTNSTFLFFAKTTTSPDRSQISAELLHTNAPATSTHVYLPTLGGRGGREGDPGADQQLLRMQLWNLCLSSSPTPSSCYLLIVITTIKACLCSLGGFQRSDSRTQNRFNTFKLYLMTVWNTFEQTGFFCLTK